MVDHPGEGDGEDDEAGDAQDDGFDAARMYVGLAGILDDKGARGDLGSGCLVERTRDGKDVWWEGREIPIFGGEAEDRRPVAVLSIGIVHAIPPPSVHVGKLVFWRFSSNKNLKQACQIVEEVVEIV